MSTSSTRMTRNEQVLAAQTKKLINRQRRLHGMRALKDDRDLVAAANARADDMAAHHFMEHRSHDGKPWFTVIEKYDRSYPHLAENIAHGFSDAPSLVKAWMNSPEHRKNILDRKNRYAGLAWAHASNGDSYIAHDFGG